MPLDSGDGRRAFVDPRDGKLKDSRDFAKDPKDFSRETAERKEHSREQEYREPVYRKEPSEPKVSTNASSSDSNAVLNSVTKSLTGDALKLGFVAALGCSAAAVPIPIVQEIGLGVCVFGGIAAAGTAVVANELEPRQPKNK